MRKIGNQTTEKLLNILQLQVTFLVSVLIMGFIITFVAFPIQVSGNSMNPTLNDADFGFSSIWSKNNEGIERYDIVIVQVEDEYWVKRVIGLPNETISCVNNQIYVNGNAIDEIYLDEEYVQSEIEEHGIFTNDFSEITLKDDEVFLMGDNRVHSLDSRIKGPFKISSIKAKDIYILWPLNHGKVVK